MRASYGTSSVPYFIREGGNGKGLLKHLAGALLHLDAGKGASPTYAYFSAFSHREAV